MKNTHLFENDTTTYINLSDLISNGYIEQDIIKDPRSSTSMKGCISANHISKNDKYQYAYDDKECSEFEDSNNMTASDPQCMCCDFDKSTGTIVRYDVNNTGCLTDVVIPDEIDGVTVKYIGYNAFFKDSSYDWDNVTILYNAANPETRFDGNWTDIGWPCHLAPSDNVCN